MKPLSLLFIILLLLFSFRINAVADQSNKTNKIQQAEVIFIHTTLACPCTLERCKSMEKKISSMITALSNNRQINYIKIDYAKDQKKADNILTGYDQFFPPCVFVFDENKKVLYKASDTINEKKFKEVLRSLIHKRK
ncbi:MAG: hypothetical protein KKH98_13035 [Spirochaetes bacterium]|nr:hypothetical protein [Spirochaetota bacterium]